MKIYPMKNIYLLLIALSLTAVGFGQTTLYNETFAGQNGKGITGGFFGGNTDVSGITTWTVSGTDIPGFGGSGNDWFRVESERFEARNTGNPGIWTTSIIDINGYSNVSITLNASTNNNMEDDDTFRTEYSINGGTWITFSNNGNLINDFNLIVSQAGLSGNTLQVRVMADNNAQSERHRFDNVKVVGTLCAPTAQATNYTTTNLNSPALGNATLNWTRGNGNNVLVVVRAGAAVTTDPTSGTAYTANSIFGSGQQVGTGNFVVYNGLSTTPTVNVTGLVENVTYYVSIYENNTSGVCYKKPALTGNFTVPCVTPINVTALTATPASQQVVVNWTNSTCFDEVLVVAKAGSAVTAVPTGNGSAYTGNASFGSGTAIQPGEFVVYKGTSATSTTTNLVNGTVYYFKVYTRKGTLWSTGVSTNTTPVNNSAYCTANSTNSSFEGIGRVRINTIAPVNTLLDNPSGRSTYTNYTTTVPAPSLIRGTQYSIIINPTFSGQSYNEKYLVFIDFNQDGDFVDTGEQVLNIALTISAQVTANFTVPTTALVSTTRMRVIMSDNAGTVNPCGTFTYGEVEDYTLNITNPAPVVYVYNNGWTPANPNGISNATDNFNILQGNAIITANTTVGTVTVGALGAMTINNGNTLTVAGAINMQSTNLRYSSLMADGIIIGTVNYDRHVNGSASAGQGSIGNGYNDLISSPLVSSQNFGQFATSNGNIRSNTDNPSLKLFGPFNKTNGAYQNYDTDIPADFQAPLTSGVGFRAASSDNGGFKFTGSVNRGIVTNNVVYSGPIYRQWNLVGNPYPAYINVADFLNYEVAPGVSNLELLPIFGGAIYGYDGDASDGYTIWNLNTPTRNMAPGQGFLIQIDPDQVAAYDLTFAPSMRRIGSTDDFIAGRDSESSNSHLKLKALIGEGNFYTDFYFNENSTSGLDRGYDATVYNSVAAAKAIYSQLVADNTGADIAIQSLAISALGSEIIVPLGINASQGQQVTVSISESDLSSQYDVYLEDAATGVFTLLNNSDYIFTPTANISGTGRFFLRFTENTLSAPDVAFKGLQIFATASPRALFVKGQLDETTSLTLYDVQGRVVLTSKLEASSTSNKVDVSNLNSGMYIVKLNNGTQEKTQKVILK